MEFATGPFHWGFHLLLDHFTRDSICYWIISLGVAIGTMTIGLEATSVLALDIVSFRSPFHLFNTMQLFDQVSNTNARGSIFNDIGRHQTINIIGNTL
jgi:hypothetical protein